MAYCHTRGLAVMATDKERVHYLDSGEPPVRYSRQLHPMNTRERQGWMIVASLFAVMVIINGSGYGAQGVFFTPLLK